MNIKLLTRCTMPIKSITKLGYVLLLSLIYVPPGVTGEVAKDSDVIIGAGAHFSWIIFNTRKSELEKILGRPLRLSGKSSGLGVGCKAGIKVAKENRPGHETFGMVCCPLSKDTIASNGLTAHPLATEPVHIVVNKSNSVKNLSARNVRAIFRGEITNWSKVGGPDKPIVVVTRNHCKKRPGHWKTIVPSVDDFRKDRINVKSASAMVKRINDFTGAIGHIGATWEYDKNDQVKFIKVGGYAPMAKNLKNKKYPFYRQLSAVTHGGISSDMKKLLRAAHTGSGFNKLSAKYGLLPN